jgi:hypothetical protein
MWHRQNMSEAPKPRPAERSLDPLVVEAAREVDQTLLDWALSLSPRERLRACSNAAITLGKFAHASSRKR